MLSRDDPPRPSLPFGRGSTSKGFRQKSFSTVSWPILACSVFTSASRSAAPREVFLANTSGRLSLACRFHCTITLGCTSCLAASSASVLSPTSASRATLALNSAEKLRRVPMANILSRQVWVQLNTLSEFRGPPLSRQRHRPVATCGTAPILSAHEPQLRYRSAPSCP